MKPLRLAAASAAVICFCLPLAGPAAGNVGQLEQKSSAAADRIEDLSGRLSRDRDGFERAGEQAEAAAAEEAGLSVEIETGSARVADLRRKLTSESESLERTRARLRRAQRLLASRLASIYMSGQIETVEIVLGSEDFGGLSTSAQYLTSIREADQQLAGRVRSTRDSLEESVDRLAQLESEAEAQVAALDAARDQIATVRARAEASAARFSSMSASRRVEIDALKADIDRWEQRIQREQAKSAAEAEAEVAAQLGGPYAIPTYIVMCESGGNYAALNPSSGAGGAYQIIPSTWEAYGGTGLPHEASKAEQDRIAALIWANDGPGAWVCAG